LQILPEEELQGKVLKIFCIAFWEKEMDNASPSNKIRGMLSRDV